MEECYVFAAFNSYHQPPWVGCMRELSQMRLPIIIAYLTASLITAPVADAMPFAYVSNFNPGTVSVIDTANNTVVTTIDVGTYVFSATVNSAGTLVYATNLNSDGSRYIWMMDTATNTLVSGPIVM